MIGLRYVNSTYKLIRKTLEYFTKVISFFVYVKRKSWNKCATNQIRMWPCADKDLRMSKDMVLDPDIGLS